MVMSETEVAIATLTIASGAVMLVRIVPSYEPGDCAFVPLGETDADGEVSFPPALTVGETESGLHALYHHSGPDDTEVMECEWEDDDDTGSYAVISVPEGVVRVPASCIRG